VTKSLVELLTGVEFGDELTYVANYRKD